MGGETVTDERAIPVAVGQVWRSRGKLMAPEFLTVEKPIGQHRWRCRANAHTPKGDYAGRTSKSAHQLNAYYELVEEAPPDV